MHSVLRFMISWQDITIIIKKLLVIQKLLIIQKLLVFGWFVFGIFGFSLVLDVSHVSGIIIHLVGDSLDATVGQENAVWSRYHFAVAALLVTKVIVGRIVFDGVLEAVGMSGLQQIENIHWSTHDNRDLHLWRERQREKILTYSGAE